MSARTPSHLNKSILPIVGTGNQALFNGVSRDATAVPEPSTTLAVHSGAIGIVQPLAGVGPQGAASREPLQEDLLRIVGEPSSGMQSKAPRRVPVISVTDLYHPHQDVGDNVDLLLPFALSDEIDLRAVILDCTERFRHAHADHPDPQYRDSHGPRDPGFVPVQQLNFLFNRRVPVAVGPFREMRSEDDPFTDVPGFQQQGIELILETLHASPNPVEICIFGSCRTVAAAFCREPDLMRNKVRRILLSAGAYPAGYLEWNVMLDRHAYHALLKSGLSIDLFPCATPQGPFDLGRHNSFWRMPDLQWMKDMDPPLRRYLAYAIQRVNRSDFLRAMEEDWPEMESPTAWKSVHWGHHNVWETVLWMSITDRVLVQREDGRYEIVRRSGVQPADRILPNDLRPVECEVLQDGTVDTRFVESPSPFRLFDRGDNPEDNQIGFCQAMPALYLKFRAPIMPSGAIKK